MPQDNRPDIPPAWNDPLLVIVGRFPWAGESFVANEIAGLIDRGVPVHVLSCTDRGAGAFGPPLPTVLFHREPGQLLALPEAFLTNPIRFIDLVFFAVSSVPLHPAGIWRALKALRIAIGMASQVRTLGVTRIHAQFLDLPALTGVLLARTLGITFSISAHARDIFVPSYHVERICREADVILTCSEAGRTHLIGSLPQELHDRVVLNRHGVEPRFVAARFPGAGIPRNRRVRLLSVSRLVAKKGLDSVFEALALLADRGMVFDYRLAGEGPEMASLRKRALDLGLQVEFLGFQERDGLEDLYSWADLVLLGCRVAADGDRDGVPNVILEAMAMGVGVIAADAGAVGEVVRKDQTGWLVPPDNPAAMAEAIEEAVSNPFTTDRMARNARERIRRDYDFDRSVNGLMAAWKGAGGL